jgi:hypothetical protein
VARSRVKTQTDLPILPRANVDARTLCPPFDSDVTQIFETMRSSQLPLVPQISHSENLEPGFAFLEVSDVTLSEEFAYLDDHFADSENQIDLGPICDSDDQRILDSHLLQIPANADVILRKFDNKQVL